MIPHNRRTRLNPTASPLQDLVARLGIGALNSWISGDGMLGKGLA